MFQLKDKHGQIRFFEKKNNMILTEDSKNMEVKTKEWKTYHTDTK